MSKITFYESKASEQTGLKELIAKTGELTGYEIIYTEDKLNDKTVKLAKEAEIISIFINSNLSKELIDQIPNLKLIVTRSTGFDHIDCGYAKEKGIKVANMPAYGSRTVAEFTFALILALSRKVLRASHEVKSGRSFNTGELMGFDLQGKTIGIVGTGRIGLNVAELAKAFRMNVIAYDLFKNEEQAKKIGFDYVPLDELLSRSDIVTLHVPNNKETRHLINKDNIVKFKKGALLINTARGEVCETEALLLGLEKKILSGVALDVLEGERDLKEESQFFEEKDMIISDAEKIKTLLEDHILRDRPEVIITPHIAFFTAEAQKEIITTSVANLVAFIKGEAKNLISLPQILA